MATLDEIAAGVSTVLLMAPAPEPLYVDMRGHSPAEVAFLIRAAVEACNLRNAPLSHIGVCDTLGSHAARALGAEPIKYEGISIELTGELDRRVEFYRFPKGTLDE